VGTHFVVNAAGSGMLKRYVTLSEFRHFINQCLDIKKKKGCPCCRQTFDKSVPMVPNIAIDNTVEKHIKALAISGATEWESEGRKYAERLSRQKYVLRRSVFFYTRS
jgi:hypothetical protein